MKYYDNIPIYIQIANDIKEQIISEKIKGGDKLPSVREYSVIYEVTPLTIQRAMQQLEIDGVIQTKKGVGNFAVNGSKQLIQDDMIQEQVTEFITRMKKMGLTKEVIISLVEEAYHE